MSLYRICTTDYKGKHRRIHISIQNRLLLITPIRNLKNTSHFSIWYIKVQNTDRESSMDNGHQSIADSVFCMHLFLSQVKTNLAETRKLIEG